MRFGAFLHAVKLVTPEALEGLGPLVHGLERLGVGAVEAMAAVSAHAHQAHTAQHAEVLRDRRLIEPDGYHNLAYVALVRGQKGEDLAAARLGDGVEWIGGGCGSRYDRNITYLYGNMSSGKSRMRVGWANSRRAGV
jgi:hypothetical protein